MSNDPHYAPSTIPTNVVDSFRYAFSSPTQLRREVFGGLIVALALVPEAISFSVLAGVDPAVGLYSSVIMTVVISLTGGRPAMIAASTGAVAVVIAPVARDYGMNYFLATVVLAGVIQLILASLDVARLLRFIPRSVMTGFVNALALVVLSGQIRHLINVPWLVYPLVLLGIAILVFLPRLSTVVPAPLVVVLLLTISTIYFDWDLPTVGDQGELPTSLPNLLVPVVPLTWETLTIIGPFALAMALVGLMESLLTAKLIDDITESHSSKARESFGQGLANVMSGLFGGMGGCTVIGQTLINVKEAQARTRLSTLLSGGFLLVLLLAFSDAVGKIPMAALVAIMLMVVTHTFDWHSVKPRTLKLMPVSETVIMLLTVATTLLTHNLAIGVGVGVLAAMVAFSRKVSNVASVTETPTGYQVNGPLFWAASNDLIYNFDYNRGLQHVEIDLSEARIWDASTVATFDAITQKYAAKGTTVSIVGLDARSQQIVDRLSGQLG
ncbi:SulP family inorganic anion transporter [Corynebacterium sp. H128]|uniref:SulP family inorganic anion transporter n=1 Tax=unclassified Corynebacterium TaxID=2624378 RepID=UPI0030AC9C52